MVRKSYVYISRHVSTFANVSVLQALPGQETPDGVPSFKLVLVGDGGTGAHPDHRTIGTRMRLENIHSLSHVCAELLPCRAVTASFVC